MHGLDSMLCHDVSVGIWAYGVGCEYQCDEGVQNVDIVYKFFAIFSICELNVGAMNKLKNLVYFVVLNPQLHIAKFDIETFLHFC